VPLTLDPKSGLSHFDRDSLARSVSDPTIAIDDKEELRTHGLMKPDHTIFAYIHTANALDAFDVFQDSRDRKVSTLEPIHLVAH
jgi:hypothetical protein